MNGIVETFPRNVVCLDPQLIPMRDGTRLAATIWLPEDAHEKPVSAILELIPYRRRDGTVFRDVQMHPFVAGHGFACCRVDIRGSGDSEGLLPDEYTEQEQDDAQDIIAWLAAQPWSTGNVGMTGISWGGFNSLQVAARQPPALKAIIALCCSDDRYADDVHYFGGCLLTEDAMWASFILALGALPPDPQIVGDQWRTMWQERLEATTCWSSTWLRHQRRDAYWKRGSVCEDFSRILVPVYAVSGWDDTYSNSVARVLSGVSAPTKGLIGPWTHSFPFMGDPGPAIGFLQEAVAWWRHWLDGEENGVMDGPQMVQWITDPHRPAPFYPDHPGRFVGDSWPPRTITPTIFALNSNGLGVRPEAGETMLLRSPVTAGRDCGRYGGYGGEVPDMALDQRREDLLGLRFDGEPLGEDLDILGMPKVRIRATSDQPLGLVAARLCEVWPDGTSTLITWGCLNLAHRHSHEHPTPLVPGELFEAEVELNDVGRRVARGNRLRLVIANQHWPILWPSPVMPTLSIESGACSLELPVRAQGDAPVTFGPAETAPHLDYETVRGDRNTRTVEVDVGSGRQAITLFSDYGQQRLTDRDIEVFADVTDRMEITDGDPLSAKLVTGWTLGFKSGEADVVSRSHVVLTADATRFHLVWRLEVTEGGAICFEREGDEWIDRDHI